MNQKVVSASLFVKNYLGNSGDVNYGLPFTSKYELKQFGKSKQKHLCVNKELISERENTHIYQLFFPCGRIS